MKGLFFIVLLAVLTGIGSSFIFSVKEYERVIKFRFGEIVRSDYEPGPHFKIPVINRIRKFDGRIQTLRTQPERFLTSEKKNVIVDSFVNWRIEDVPTYYRAVRGSVVEANERLEQIIKNGLRSEFSKRTIRDLVSSDRDVIRDLLVEHVNTPAKFLGIRLIEVRIKRIELPSEVSSSVYHRMEAERARVAQEFRSRGAEYAERIRADADKQSEVILAEAYRDTEVLRGAGDARAAEIYSGVYGRYPEFFAFYRSLQAYRQAFGAQNNILVLEPDSEFFQYFGREQVR